jgi:hypothetical protein
VIGETDIRRVQEWMGHADAETTMRYLHYAPRHDDAAIVGRAFETLRSAAGSPALRGWCRTNLGHVRRV